MALSWWQRLVHGKTRPNQPARARGTDSRRTTRPLALEELEGRLLLSTSSVTPPAIGSLAVSSSTATVQLVPTTTTWSSSATPMIFGQAAVFTVKVTPGSGTAKPTGQVTFKDGTTVLGTAPLGSTGLATFTITSLNAGTHSITASYVSDGTFSTSTSPAQSQVVSPAHDLVLLQSSPPPAFALSSGQSVTLTASVIGTTVGAGNPTGLLQFLDGVNTLGQPVALNGSGDAILTTSFTGPSSHNITARYLGDAHFQTTTSAALALQVTATVKAASVTKVTTPTTSLALGQALNVTVQVTGATTGAPTPTGQVQFTVDGTNVGGPSALDAAGKITTAFTNFQLGGHTLTTTYLGDGHYSTSSQSLSIQVGGIQKASTSTTLTTSAASALVGQPITLTAKVAATGTSTVKPTGQVQFLVDGKNQGLPVTLDGTGSASLAVTWTVSGSHTVAAHYIGDTLNSPSDSKPLSIQVNAPQLARSLTTLTSSSAAPAFGQKVTFTAAVSAATAGTVNPTGKVQFYANGSPLSLPVALDAGGKAILAIATLPPGSKTITAKYLGDNVFGTSISAGQVLQVSKGKVTIAVTSSAGLSVPGQQVSFTAQVLASVAGAPLPTGKVQFLVNGVAVGLPVALDAAGKATFATTFNQEGFYHITVQYLGDADFAGSISSIYLQWVAQPGQVDPGLAKVIAAWSTLSDATRKAILALLGA